MPVIVTLDLYSGLPNPSWELSAEQAAELTARFGKERAGTLQQSAASLGLLGYRGFTVQSVAEPPGLAAFSCFDGVIQTEQASQINFVDHDSDIESFLLSTGSQALTDEERQHVEGEIQKNSSAGAAAEDRGMQLEMVPPYNPSKWNGNQNVLLNNNCYNYANDLITNTFAQPGRGSGQVGPYPPTCAGTSAAAQRDGQISQAAPTTCPAQGHIIALVVSSAIRDYHWYRQDVNGLWSHKPGHTAARNVDNSNQLIRDPRTCDRRPYEQFCGFFHCIPANVRIR